MSEILIFVSYSHADSHWVKEGKHCLIPWLATSLKHHQVTFWYDRLLQELPGEDYREEIATQIDRAHFAILLLSQSFLNSEFVTQFELPRIECRDTEGKLSIVPILVEPTIWEAVPRELHWLQARQIIANNNPLINQVENTAMWSRTRGDILRIITRRIETFRNPRPAVVNVAPAGVRPLSLPNAPPSPQPVAPSRLKRFWPLVAVVLAVLLLLGLLAEHVITAWTVPSGMTRIPAGIFRMGGEDAALFSILRRHADSYTDEALASLLKPRKTQVLAVPFFIDKYETSNLEYSKFLASSGRPSPPHWEGGTIPSGQENRPVVNVTWEEAAAYAQWAKKRLPTSQEWERAAAGPEGRLFPWGNQFDVANCNTFDSPTTGPVDVDEYESGKSAEGIYNLVGNVAEWTSSYESNATAIYYIFRGGSFIENCEMHGLSSYVAAQARPDVRSESIGFRCVRDDIADDETHLPENMVRIANGPYTTGTDALTLKIIQHLKLSGRALLKVLGEEPKDESIAEFFIDQREVTVRQYRRFLREEGASKKWAHPKEPPSKSRVPDGWNELKPGNDDFPVFGIDWFDAYAYAKWAGKRLPTPLEWEKAARSDDGRLYPWGNTFDPKFYFPGNVGARMLVPVTAIPTASLPYGLAAMSGNVAEWVDGGEPANALLLGGAWNDSPPEIFGLAFVSINANPLHRGKDTGFRCAADRRPSLVEKILHLRRGNRD